ncbi:MAG: hypothetical protein ABI165_12435 [Bryobacteraceae bacterium]
MKKLMSLMLGMSLVFGAASIAFAQDSTTPTTKKTSKKKTHHKKSTDQPATSPK